MKTASDSSNIIQNIEETHSRVGRLLQTVREKTKNIQRLYTSPDVDEKTDYKAYPNYGTSTELIKTEPNQEKENVNPSRNYPSILSSRGEQARSKDIITNYSSLSLGNTSKDSSGISLPSSSSMVGIKSMQNEIQFLQKRKEALKEQNTELGKMYAHKMKENERRKKEKLYSPRPAENEDFTESVLNKEVETLRNLNAELKSKLSVRLARDDELKVKASGFQAENERLSRILNTLIEKNFSMSEKAEEIDKNHTVISQLRLTVIDLDQETELLEREYKCKLEILKEELEEIKTKKIHEIEKGHSCFANKMNMKENELKTLEKEESELADILSKLKNKCRNISEEYNQKSQSINKGFQRYKFASSVIPSPRSNFNPSICLNDEASDGIQLKASVIRSSLDDFETKLHKIVRENDSLNEKLKQNTVASKAMNNQMKEYEMMIQELEEEHQKRVSTLNDSDNDKKGNRNLLNSDYFSGTQSGGLRCPPNRNLIQNRSASRGRKITGRESLNMLKNMGLDGKGSKENIMQIGDSKRKESKSFIKPNGRALSPGVNHFEILLDRKGARKKI